MLKESTSIFEKKEFPIPCEKCELLGWIFVDDTEQPCYVVCSKCKEETSEVWCPKCSMGGSYVRRIDLHPLRWTCPGCHTTYSLPDDFYDHPLNLFDLDDLPAEVKKRILQKYPVGQNRFMMVGIFLFFIYLALVIVVALWPLMLYELLAGLPSQFLLLKIFIPIAGVVAWFFLGAKRVLYIFTKVSIPILNKFGLGMHFTEATIKKYEKPAE